MWRFIRKLLLALKCRSFQEPSRLPHRLVWTRDHEADLRATPVSLRALRRHLLIGLRAWLVVRAIAGAPVGVPGLRQKHSSVFVPCTRGQGG